MSWRTLLKQRLCWGPHLQHIHLTHKILLQSPLTHTGVLPDSIGNLSALQTLLLNGNHFEGTEFCTEHETQPRRTLLTRCPSTITLSRFFDFSRSLFAGELPESIGNLSALKELYLAQNRFSGESNNHKLDSRRTPSRGCLFETSVMTKSFTYTLDRPSHTQARFPTRSGTCRRCRLYG